MRPAGARGDRRARHPQGVVDRYDPEPLLVFVDERTDQRCSGSHSRAKKIVAALRISIVASSSLVLRRSCQRGPVRRFIKGEDKEEIARPLLEAAD